MAGLTPAEQAAAALLEAQETLARRATERLYAEVPGLLEKYGERGREKCLQDVRHTLEHLASAVALDAPPLFARYAAWADDLLTARNVPTGELVRSIELLAAEAGMRLSAEGREVVERCAAAGVAALHREDGR